MVFWTIVLTTVISLLLLYHFSGRENWFDKHGILYKKPFPLVGNLGPSLLQRIPLIEYLQKVYNLHPDAKYVGFFDIGSPVIVIRDLELAKNITVKYFDHFVNHRGFVDPKYEPLFGNNLFQLHDDKWREVRNILSPAFTSSKMKGMFKLMSQCAANFANYVAEESMKKPLEVNSKDAFTRYTNDVIGTCAFGIAIDSMRNPDNEFYVLGRKALTFDGILSVKFFFARSFPTVFKLFGIKMITDDVAKFFYDIVKDTIAMRDAKGITRPDMIQLMMETRNSKDGQGPKLTIEEMTSQAFVFFFGGFDTSSALMCFVAHQIAADPDVQAKLQKEVDEVFEEYNEDPPYDAVNGMVYLDAVITESLRMYPIAGFLDRVCNTEFELPPALPGRQPVTLKPGNCVWIPTYPIHRDPKYYPNPEVFSPERFIDNGKISTNSNFPILSFGVGPRMCIGNRFALLETKVLLVHVLRRCSLKPAKRMITPLQLSTKSLAMTAKGGFWLEFQLRKM